MGTIAQWLAHPLTRGINMDDPRATHLRRRIIHEKPFLRQIYVEWYSLIARSLPARVERVLELGSGAGFMEAYVPALVKSEVFYVPGAALILDGQALPFGDGALDGIVMTNVLHHIPCPRQFFAEAVRCVRPGGTVVMIEPWVTPWSRFFYHFLHYEPFTPDAPAWEFPSSGPLSGANDAMPWMIFERDAQRFASEFPGLRLEHIHRFMPFRYMASGGISMRKLAPDWSFGLWRQLEDWLQPWSRFLAMFALIVLRREED